MAERVVEVDLDVVWDPNAESGRLSVTEDGDATLELLAHFQDTDRRSILLAWTGVRAARMEDPNDEARSGHPLYAAGLREVRWIGRVLDSSLVAELERRNSRHLRHNPDRFVGLHHWVLPLKGSVVEVVGLSLAVGRREAGLS